ncbi:MAG: hypothetical protein RLN81_00205 [Balneolaceae bacterium]
MKKILVLITACILTNVSVNAQWTTSGSDIYFNSGNVGIGITSPIAKLHVNGDTYLGTNQLQFLSASGGNNRIFSAGGTSPGSWTFKSRFDNMIFSSGENSSNPRRIIFRTGDGDRMEIGASGRVGIGNAAIDITGTALDQLVIGDGIGSRGVVVYHGTNNDGGYAFANPSGNLTGRILYDSSEGAIKLQYVGTDRLTIGSNRIELLKNTEIDGRLFFGDFSNEGVGTIQIKNEGPNDGIALWTETGNITKRIWIDDSTNTLQLTAGVSLNNGLSLDENGNIGIGTSNPDQALTVKGKIHSEEIIVDLNVPGPDYVFEEDYDLPTLSEIEAFIKANKHLPEIPSAKEMEANGISLGEMNMLLLKKIEELTLITIQQQKQINELIKRDEKN